MKKPIYLYLTPFFPSPKTWSGGFCLDAVKALKADGRYDVIVMTAEDYGGDYEIDGIKVYQFPRVKLGAWEYCETFFIGKKNRLFLNKLKQMGISPMDVAICHVHDFIHYIAYALALKKLNPKCKTIVHHHYAGYYNLSIGNFGVLPIWSDLLYLKMRREFEAADAHVFISEHCRDKYGRFVEFDTGIDKGLLREQLPWGKVYRPIRLPASYVWYNGVDTTLFHCKDACETRCQIMGSFTVGCVANFNPCKCQIDLIKAIEIVRHKIPNVQLKLLGTGRTRAVCERYVKENGLGGIVEFVDPISHDKLANFYTSLDLFVMPSVNEGFCCVNVEAHACGVPFMAASGLPMEEVLDKTDYDAWLFAPHDIDGLAFRIVSFFNRPREQQLIVDLDSNKLATKYCNWLEGLR